MSWGDPFYKFYKDDSDKRQAVIVDSELTPGTMVTYGKLGSGKTMYVWSMPDFQSDSQPVVPGVGVIIAVDCESDPTADWLMLLLNTPARQMFGWLPTSLVKRVE